MKALLLLACSLSLFVIVLKVRLDTRRARTSVLARLAAETDGGPPTSPTEELFRAEGVPVSDELRQGLATAPPTPSRLTQARSAATDALQRVRSDGDESTGATTVAEAPADELRRLFEGIRMPCGLVPIAAPGDAAAAAFATPAEEAADLEALLEAALDAIGARLTWVDDSTALVRRDDAAAMLTVYRDAATATGADGHRAFPTVGPGQVVVKITTA